MILLKSYYSYGTYFILLEKMRNLVETGAVKKLNWKKLVDKIIPYCFIEWNINMI